MLPLCIWITPHQQNPADLEHDKWAAQNVEKLAAAAGQFNKEAKNASDTFTWEMKAMRTGLENHPDFEAKEWETPTLTNGTLSQCLWELHYQHNPGAMQSKMLPPHTWRGFG